MSSQVVETVIRKKWVYGTVSEDQRSMVSLLGRYCSKIYNNRKSQFLRTWPYQDKRRLHAHCNWENCTNLHSSTMVHLQTSYELAHVRKVWRNGVQKNLFVTKKEEKNIEPIFWKSWVEKNLNREKFLYQSKIRSPYDYVQQGSNTSTIPRILQEPTHSQFEQQPTRHPSKFPHFVYSFRICRLKCEIFFWIMPP